MTEETLFECAVKLPPAERAAFLDRECAGNPELRGRVESLLAADAVSHSPLDHSVAVHDHTGDYTPESEEPQPLSREMISPPPDRQAGAVIAGKYMLKEVIGEGGMGAVWRAKQTEPVQRFVAVKLIKAGMDSNLVLARFEAERQALALMDHPNIAKVLDGGVHDGRPFFVMELIKGTPITTFCDARRLNPQERLELFVQACQAIQHAHQKGIIHRDIKPTNVLVALYDDRPVVKVIDFGVAKATGGTLTEKTLDTGFAGIVGTPQYMSPEQATFNNLDIDTRTDVYALGVLLYELLVGSPPFCKKELEKQGLLEILRIVREEEPPRPSTKLSTSDALPSLSANRGMEPKKLTGLLRNELDWIVLKALEKDRTRRYETANGFAADVQRYLGGDAVQAVPPSWGYQLRKAYRRNRVAVLVGAAFALVLSVTTGVSITLAVWATQAEREAKSSLHVTQTTLRFMQDDLLDPTRGEGNEADPDLKMRVVLDRAATRIDGRYPDQPGVEAHLHRTVGRGYISLGEPTLAASHLSKAADTFDRVYGPEHVYTKVAFKELAMSYVMFKDPRAEAALVRVARLDLPDWESDPVRRAAVSMLVGVYREGSRLDEAERLARQVLDVRRRQEGPDHFSTLTSAEILGKTLYDQKRFPEAEAALREAYTGRRRTLGADHLDTAGTAYHLALALNAQKKREEARPLFLKAAEVFRAKLGEHRRAAKYYWAVALQVGCIGDDPVPAQPYAMLALRCARRYPGVLSPDHCLSAFRLIGNRLMEHRPDLGEPLLRDWLTVSKSTTPVERLRRAEVEILLGHRLWVRRDYGEAEPVLLAAYRRLNDLPADLEHRDARFGDVLKELERLYDSTDRPAEAKKYRDLRAKYPTPKEATPMLKEKK